MRSARSTPRRPALTEPNAEQTNAARPTESRRLFLVIKLTVTAGLLAFLLSRVDWDVLRTGFLELNVSFVGLAFIAFVGIAIFEVIRMKAVLAAFDLGWVDLWRMHLVAVFFGTFMPGQVGADLYRIHFLRRRSHSVDHGLTLILLIRVVGFLLMSIIGISGLLAYGPTFEVKFSAAQLQGFFLVSLLITTLLLFFVVMSPRIRRRLTEFYQQAKQALVSLSQRQLLALLGLSVLVVGSRALVVDFLTAATGSPLHGGEALFVVSLATLTTLVPISFAGLGLREGAITAGLLFFQVPYEAAVLVAILGRAFMLAMGAAGGLWYAGYSE